MPNKTKPFTLPKFNPLGIGIVYLLIYVPDIYAVKIGYTGHSIKSRVRGTSKAVRGFTIPIGFMIVPWAWNIEQAMHDLFSGLRIRFYRGDGSTETFLAIVIPIVWGIFGLVWWGEVWMIQAVLKFV